MEMIEWFGGGGGRKPRDLVGHSPREYRQLPCGKCGLPGDKTLEVITDESDGFAQVIIACNECGHGNKWVGHIDTDFF